MFAGALGTSSAGPGGPYETVIGRVPGLEGFHDGHFHPDAKHLPGLVIYRFDDAAVAAYTAGTGADWSPGD